MSRQARLGLLVTTGTILFVLMLFLLARRSFLFADVFPLDAEFSSVAGLEPGAPVQYRGIAVGSVEYVTLPETPEQPIRVRMAIRTDAGKLIRADSEAHIKSDGVLGNQLVVLQGGSDSAPPVQEGGMILGVAPMDLMEAAERAISTVAVFDSVITSIGTVLQQIERGDGTIGRLFADPTLYDRSVYVASRAETTLENVSSTFDSLNSRIEASLAALDAVVLKVSQGDGTLSQLINDPAIHDQIASTSKRLDELVTAMDSLVTEAQFASEWGNVTLQRAAENMAALQKHWLFRRYFRGKESNLEMISDSLFESQMRRRLEAGKSESSDLR